MQIYMELLKGFCQKYKRYFGALALFVLWIVVLVQFAGEQEPGMKTGAVGTESETGTTEITSEGGLLDGEFSDVSDEELEALIQAYYGAYVDADIVALEKLASPITDHEKSYISTFAEFYEEYQNIACYYLREETDHYFVSVCYDLKFKDIDTPAAGMDFFYVERDGKGNLFINNAYSAYNFNFMETELDANIYAKILTYEQLPQVIALQKEVQTRYEANLTGDEQLANFVGGTIRNVVAQWRESLSGETQGEEPPATEGENHPDENAGEAGEDSPGGDNHEEPNETGEEEPGQEGQEEPQDEPQDTTYKVKALANCNIRAEATTNSAVIGQVRKGAKLTAVGTEDNWTKLDFNGETGYIRSDLIKNVD